jgi:hypothetical protein
LLYVVFLFFKNSRQAKLRKTSDIQMQGGMPVYAATFAPDRSRHTAAAAPAILQQIG